MGWGSRWSAVACIVAVQLMLVCSTRAAQSAANQELLKQEELFKHTEYEASLALLDQKSADPAVNFLVGRNYFMLGDFKKASDFLQKAVAHQSSNSEYMDWLGRAYGKRAETSNPLSAPGWASKARQAFERAIELDPKNSDAVSDVFDYYLEAPGFLGGGIDKAEKVAVRLAAVDPSESYYMQAKVAQHRKEFGTAEQRLRQAVAVAPQQVGHLITLARFLAKQGRTKESDAIFLEAANKAPNSPGVWFARADTLIQQKRNYSEAKLLLKKYVSASITVDDPPKEEAMRLLKQVGS